MGPTGLLDLPNELLIDVSESVHNSKNLATLVKTCRGFHAVANGLLYKRDACEGQGRALLWAASRGVIETIRLSLDAGALVDHAGIGPPISNLAKIDATALQTALLCR